MNAPNRLFRLASASRRLLRLTPLLLLNACEDGPPTLPDPLDLRPNDVVLEWNAIAFETAATHDGHANGLDMVRIAAMLHLAQHDALSAISPSYQPYAMHAYDPAADPIAAAAAAAHGVLVAVYPLQRATLDDRLQQSLAAVANGVAQTRGIALGEKAAAAILQRRADDRSDTPIVGDYVPAAGAGRYQFTPPFDFAALPGWVGVAPFALTSANQFRSPPPPALDSEAYAVAFNEVRSVGQKGSTTRTAEQTAYGKFWYEFSEIGWNRIGRVVAADKRLGLQSTARLLALLNVAMSDAYVAGWDSKFHYDFWRPFTAIREAATDGNPATEPDATWESAEMTPPVQDYPSTHSALGNAAAEVLASVFGDETSFTFASSTAEPVGGTRSFTSFSQAADENADSRVVAGLHFRFACEAGQELGRQVGTWAVQNHLRAR